MMITTFLNLSNGLLAGDALAKPFALVRIQSTACEQKRWGFILEDLDHTFLMPVALGLEVHVHDFGARAVWQGLPWIRYALTRAWRLSGYMSHAVVRGNDCAEYFDQCWWSEVRHASAERKLEYYRRFAPTAVRIVGHSARTELDGDTAEIAAAARRLASG